MIVLSLFIQLVAMCGVFVCAHEANTARHTRDMSDVISDYDRRQAAWRIHHMRVIAWNDRSTLCYGVLMIGMTLGWWS